MRSHNGSDPRPGARRPLLLAAGLLAAFVLSACTPSLTIETRESTGVRIVADASWVVRIPASRPAEGVSVRGEHGPAIHIPPGHYPPPGQCRVWRPGVPPGHQDPPGPCGELERIRPQGAYLIYG